MAFVVEVAVKVVVEVVIVLAMMLVKRVMFSVLAVVPGVPGRPSLLRAWC